jgi:hypothetical protein
MGLVYTVFGTFPGAVFYKSFAGYRLPPKLQSPILFEETARLASFYIAHHHKDGRLAWFAKILAEQRPDERKVELSERRQPRALVFFKAVRQGPQKEDVVVDGPVDYADTKDQSEYFEGEVGAPGSDARATLICRNVFFADLYAYWPSGKVKQRKLVRSDGSASLWCYDQRGKLVNQSKTPSGGFSASQSRVNEGEEGQWPVACH